MAVAYTETRRDVDDKLKAQLDVEYSTFMPHHREIADFFCPRRPQFFVTDNNRGDRKSTKIIDATGTMAADTFASGMMAGNTSPTSPWLRLTTSNPVMAENYEVQAWLDEVTDLLLTVFAKSNIYDSFRQMYEDGALFWTAPVLIEEDVEKVIKTTCLPPGSYRLALGKNGKVEVLFRDFRMTVRELVNEFGMEFGEEDINWSRFSRQVKEYWERGQRETWIDVCHVVTQNDEYDPERIESKYKKFRSCYYERGTTGGTKYETPRDAYLRESGYDRFPVLVYRFKCASGDAYGTDGPGAVALGDVKALQHLHKRHAQAVDKMVNPPMGAPASMENKRWSTLPNDVAYRDLNDNGLVPIAPLYQVQPNTSDLLIMIRDHQFRINQAFFVDVILSLINPQVDPKTMTAREVDERHDEKYMRFGSVMERINQDVLAPATEITLQFMQDHGMIPPPPEELMGDDIKIEFISAMAASQKLIRLGGLERFTQFYLSLAESNPSLRAKVNEDNLLDAYAEGSSLPAKCMATDEDAFKVRQAQAQAQAMQAQVEAAPQISKAMKDLSETKVDEDSALSRVAGAIQQNGGLG